MSVFAHGMPESKIINWCKYYIWTTYAFIHSLGCIGSPKYHNHTTKSLANLLKKTLKEFRNY